MKKSLVITALLSLCVTGLLVSCDNNGNTNNGGEVIFDHYFSNQVSFADLKLVNDYEDLQEKSFLSDKIALCKLKNITDGDTAVFYLPNGEEDSFTHPLKYSYNYVTLRYLAIDTPESTSQIQAWGKAASDYGKSLLKTAEAVILDASSIDTSEYENKVDSYTAGVRFDSNGRWLAMVWYCPEGQDPQNLENYRSYQLDMIEECFTFYTSTQKGLGENTIYDASKKDEPELYEKYKSTFGSLTLGEVCTEAALRMDAKEQRYTGYQKDPNFDYARRPTDYTITEACANFEELSTSGKFVRLKGVITAFVGTNFYFQDELGTPLYVYMGIEGNNLGGVFKVGDTIMISGRMCEYGGQMQMSGINWDDEDTFAKVTGEDAIPMPEVIKLDSTALDVDVIPQYIGKLVEIDVTLSNLGRISKDYSYTAYCEEEIKGLGGSYKEISVRINGSLAPGYNRDTEIEPLLGKKVTVTAIMGIYQEDDYTQAVTYPSYQLVVANRKIVDGVTLSDIVEAQ